MTFAVALIQDTILSSSPCPEPPKGWLSVPIFWGVSKQSPAQNISVAAQCTQHADPGCPQELQQQVCDLAPPTSPASSCAVLSRDSPALHFFQYCAWVQLFEVMEPGACCSLSLKRLPHPYLITLLYFLLE